MRNNDENRIEVRNHFVVKQKSASGDNNSSYEDWDETYGHRLTPMK